MHPPDGDDARPARPRRHGAGPTGPGPIGGVERMLASEAAEARAADQPATSFDAIIIGAGIAGMYQLHRLRRARPLGARLRDGQRRRRHLVLEPLPRRALRLRELHLRLLLLGGAAAGLELERALRAAAGDAALPGPRRGPVRPAPRHPVRQPRRRRPLGRGRAPLARDAGRRRDLRRALPDHGGRAALRRHPAAHPGHRRTSGAGPSTPTAGRTSRWTSRASASPSSASAPPACR